MGDLVVPGTKLRAVVCQVSPLALRAMSLALVNVYSLVNRGLISLCKLENSVINYSTEAVSVPARPGRMVQHKQGQTELSHLKPRQMLSEQMGTDAMTDVAQEQCRAALLSLGPSAHLPVGPQDIPRVTQVKVV